MIVPDPQQAPQATLRRHGTLTVEFAYRLEFTHGAFEPGNPLLADTLVASGPGPAAAVVFADQGVLDRRPNLPHEVRHYLDQQPRRIAMCGEVWAVPGGEQAKNDRVVVDTILACIDRAHLCRQSYVICIGGGAVQDVVGFAAATAHRGIRLIRLPTSTLSQTDSGVGVKNGINAFSKKNYLGTFSVPWAVINDVGFLATLSDRDWRCGFSEVVKVALMKDAELFEQTAAAATRLAGRDWGSALPIIQRSCELHYEHIADGGDPFERTTARPLDFGHWAAHRLEQLSHFDLRHGEAVAIGVALDVVYSALSGFLDWDSAERIMRCLERLGFAVYDDHMADREALWTGIAEFREHLGGRLHISMLRGIGQGFEVHEIDRERMGQAVDYLARR